jgi:hypothetical protein
VPRSRIDDNFDRGNPLPYVQVGAGEVVAVSGDGETCQVDFDGELVGGVVVLGDRPEPGDWVEVHARGDLLVTPEVPLDDALPPAPTGSYYTEVMADGPAGYWRMNDTTGTVMTDASGHDRHGTYVNSPSLDQGGLLVHSGDDDPAISLDNPDPDGPGPAQHCLVDHAAWMPDATDPFTVELLFRLVAFPPGTRTLIYRPSYLMVGVGGTDVAGETEYSLFFDFGTSGVTTAVGGITPGVRHVVATWTGMAADTGAWSLYLDGAQVAVDTTTDTQTTSTADLEIGFCSDLGGVNRFEGVIDEVAVYDRALSAARVAAHYDASQIWLWD